MAREPPYDKNTSYFLGKAVSGNNMKQIQRSYRMGTN